VGRDLSDHRRKRAKALDGQESRVEPTPVRDQEAILKASLKPVKISQGMELEEGILRLQGSPGSTPYRSRRPEGPLPGEETEWDTTEEDSSVVVSEEGTADEGEATDTDEGESASSGESSTESGDESTSEGEESTGNGGESTDEGEESTASGGESTIEEAGSTANGGESTTKGEESAAVTQRVQGKYCQPCNKHFTRLSDLKRHLKSSQAHGVSSPVCGHCGAILARGDGLERHLKICPAIKAKRNGNTYSQTAKRRGRPTLRGSVDIQGGGSTAGQASGSSRTTKTTPRSQRATQPLAAVRTNPTRKCRRV